MNICSKNNVDQLIYIPFKNYLRNKGFAEKRLTPDRVGMGSRP